MASWTDKTVSGKGPEPRRYRSRPTSTGRRRAWDWRVIFFTFLLVGVILGYVLGKAL